MVDRGSRDTWKWTRGGIWAGAEATAAICEGSRDGDGEI